MMKLTFVLVICLHGVCFAEHCSSNERVDLALDNVNEPGYVMDNIRDLQSMEECVDECCQRKTEGCTDVSFVFSGRKSLCVLVHCVSVSSCDWVYYQNAVSAEIIPGQHSTQRPLSQNSTDTLNTYNSTATESLEAADNVTVTANNGATETSSSTEDIRGITATAAKTTALSNTEMNGLNTQAATKTTNVNQSPRSNTASTLSYDRGSTSTPSYNQGSTSTPSYDQGTASTPSYNQGTASTPSYDQGTASTPSYDQGSTSTRSYDQSSTSTASYDQGSTSTLSYDQGSTSTPSHDQSSTSTPSNDQGSTSTRFYDQGSDSTTSYYRRSSTTSYNAGQENTETFTSSSTDNIQVQPNIDVIDLSPMASLSSQTVVIISLLSMILIAVVVGVLLTRWRPCRFGGRFVPKRDEYRPLDDTNAIKEPFHDYVDFDDQ